MDQEFEQEPLELCGIIEAVIYANEENGYAVLKVKDTDTDCIVTLVGCVPYPAAGESVSAYGCWVEHSEYGRQFRVDYARRMLPESAEGIYSYLASGVIKGIGPAMAALIVEKFGDKALEVIENSPEKLSAIKGISSSRAKEFSKRYGQISVMRRLIEYLSSYSIRPVLAIRLYRYYGKEAFRVLNSNPYVICTGLIGGKFSEADSLAISLGFQPDCRERIKAAALFELKYNLGNGHCFIPKAMLIDATSGLIGVESSIIEECISDLVAENEIVLEKLKDTEACYLPELYEAETGIASRLSAAMGECSTRFGDIEEFIKKSERISGMQYAENQKEILRKAVNSRVLAITGGPGTGKTTSVRALIGLFDELKLDTQLAAPTGRAAKRMSELTGRDAATIHRLLGAQYSEDGDCMVFTKDEEDRLKCDAIIIDECSMIDMVLMNALLKALPENARIIMVGDVDQLPPVGAGNCFKSILESGAVETVRLTAVFRQSENSDIVKNAHKINRGEYIDFTKKSSDFFRLKRLDGADSVETITELCASRLPQKMNIMPEEIQVLTPTRKGDLGTVNLNKRLQEALNPKSAEKPEKLFGDFIFRVGDRVMQIRNNYDIIWHSSDMTVSGNGIFNGDIGYIRKIDAMNELITIDFDGKIAEYGYELLSELEHAWAVTVHKAQGSEYRAVIFALSPVSKLLLTREIIYTGVTRAKELLILVGADETARAMIDNNRKTRRFTFLRLRLRTLQGIQ